MWLCCGETIEDGLLCCTWSYQVVSYRSHWLLCWVYLFRGTLTQISKQSFQPHGSYSACKEWEGGDLSDFEYDMVIDARQGGLCTSGTIDLL